MPKIKTIAPIPDRHKGERNVDDPLYLVRYLPSIVRPTQVSSAVWRALVESQPVCLICRETLTANILALDWKIEPRDSDRRDEYKSEIDYYTKLFEYTGDYDYAELIEWISTDYSDLPFGAGAEVGRSGDDPEGKLLWIELLDGGTLFPTLNSDWPVGQVIGTQQVYFPKHAINRLYMSPRTDIYRKGWGFAAPEKIYFALQLVSRGDYYYANLLLDSPEAGILDLLDMSKDSATEWIKSWKAMLTGIDPFKIPVLYEHTQSAKWIPFTRNPTEIMFDTAMARYTALITAGYGMSPSDIGFGGGQNGGNTMAGNMRDERRTKRNGFVRLKKKVESFFNRLLPSYLRFKFVDLDDEMSIALGRARLANSTAWNSLISGGVFTREEARQQTIADGLVSISIPETIPKEALEEIANQQNANKPAERPSMLGRPVSPSSGGWGEVAAKTEFADGLRKLVDLSTKEIQRCVYDLSVPVIADFRGTETVLEDVDAIAWRSRFDSALWIGEGGDHLPELTNVLLKSVIPTQTEKVRDIVSSCFDFNKLQVDCSVLQSDVLTDVITMENDRRYIMRKSEYNSEVEYDIYNVVMRYIEILPSVLVKSCISSIRSYLFDHTDATQDEIVFNQSVVNIVRGHLKVMGDALLNDFIDEVTSDLLNKVWNDAT